jgi:hypothetical protein
MTLSAAPDRNDLGGFGMIDGGENVVRGSNRRALCHTGSQHVITGRADVVDEPTNQFDFSRFNKRTSRHSRFPFVGPSKGRGIVTGNRALVKRKEFRNPNGCPTNRRAS